MLRTSDLEYELPEELLATSPMEPRDAARLMVVSRSDPRRLEHRIVRDLPELLRAGDLMVLNTTRVIPARLIGRRADTGGRVEGLYLDDAAAYSGSHAGALSCDAANAPLRWAVLLQGKRMKAGIDVVIELARDEHAEHAGDSPGSDSGVVLRLIEPLGHEDRGGWITEVREHTSNKLSTAGTHDSSHAILERVGRTPLPPYILKARERAQSQGPGEAYDRARYQTVYAEGAASHAGSGTDAAGSRDIATSAHVGASVAAPTAGLHLTPGVLDALRARGVGRADVTLHVGSGTFRPVETEFVEQHAMHTERCSMAPATRDAVARARRDGSRVICVGTTSARTVESFARYAATNAGASPDWLATDILITPGYPWLWTDGLLTNFHLPRSTLLAMVASLFPEGVARLREIYSEAVREKYRFYSYGDAMLILP